MTIIIETERLILREWEVDDITPFTAINMDPKVMEFFPELGDRNKSAWLIGRCCQHYYDYGFTLYPVELKKTGEFIGFTGLMNVHFKAGFTPAVEVGWRLASQHWGKGYAPEAALKVLSFAFESLGLEEVVSFTTENNMKSRRVMEKIGMCHNPKDDFLHPNIDHNHPLAKHVLYRINSAQNSMRG